MSETKKVEKPDYMAFTAYPRFFVVWPIILIGILLPALERVLPGVFTQKVSGSIWVITFVFVVVALGFNFDGIASMIIAVLVAMFFLAAAVLHDRWDIPVLQKLGKVISGLIIHISASTMMLFTVIFGILWVFMLIAARLNDHWVVTNGKMERAKFPLRGIEQLGISTIQKVSYQIDNMLIFLLTFGGGKLIVKTGSDTERVIGIVFFVRSTDAEIDNYETTPTTEEGQMHNEAQH